MSHQISKVQTPKRNESLANMNIEENMAIVDDEMDSILDPEELLDNPRTINAAKNENEQEGAINEKDLMNELSKLAQEQASTQETHLASRDETNAGNSMINDASIFQM